ncbi:GntR family transcriptional regulator [Metarhizobium album]|uniref:GntR family transcriptional regulator n=1 Tax=Metarhizobium album TaxID=2182425 RepID=A0A2U2DLQ7_9HYPH|nr:FCD domain-containing protein [Rhizobium album]PWE54238.1 GntR family transcriptional regulator [Rhizobium album]
MDSLVVPFLALAAALPGWTLPRGSEPDRVAADVTLETRLTISSAPNCGYRVAAVSFGELEDLELAREAVECALLEDAIVHGGMEWEANIIAAHYNLSRCPQPIGSDDVEERLRWIDVHDGFHRRLAAAARSSWLKSFQDQLFEQLQRHHQALLFHPDVVSPSRPPKSEGETEAMLHDVLALAPHTQIMQAALDRDVGAAVVLLRTHIHLALDLHRAIAGIVARAAEPVKAKSFKK